MKSIYFPIGYAMFLALFLTGCDNSYVHELPHDQVRVGIEDNLEIIAYRHGMKVNDLIKYNGILSPYAIEVGQVLSIPEDSSVAEVKETNASAQGRAMIGPDAELPKSPTGTQLSDMSLSIMEKRKKAERQAAEKQEAKKKENTKKHDITAQSKKELARVDEKKKDTKKPQEGFVPPMRNYEVVQGVGQNTGTLKLKAKNKGDVRAIGDGEIFVSDKPYPNMGGRMVVIKHKHKGKTYLSIYGGMKEINEDILKRKIKTVQTGDVIGNLGMSTEKAHMLYFEVRHESTLIKPDRLIPDFFKKAATVKNNPVKK